MACAVLNNNTLVNQPTVCCFVLLNALLCAGCIKQLSSVKHKIFLYVVIKDFGENM